MEQGQAVYQEQGMPQGGVISPILSNIYLHEALDGWFVKTVRPRLKGKAFMVRYAEDAVIGCEEADRIMKVLALRFAKYGLTIHPEKTRLIDFTEPEGGAGKGKFYLSGVYPLLDEDEEGEVDSGAQDRKETVVEVDTRENRRQPVKEQHEKLTAKLRGRCAYYGITGGRTREVCTGGST
jgi:hypothetical protein